MEEEIKANVNEVVVLTAGIRRKISSWKPRIYKRFRTIREFLDPMGISGKRFTNWIHLRFRPSVSVYNEIEKRLTDLGV